MAFSLSCSAVKWTLVAIKLRLFCQTAISKVKNFHYVVTYTVFSVLVYISNIFEPNGKTMSGNTRSSEKHKKYFSSTVKLKTFSLNITEMFVKEWALKYCCCVYRSVEANRPISPIRTQSMYRPTPQRKPPPKPSGANIYKVSH